MCDSSPRPATRGVFASLYLALAAGFLGCGMASVSAAEPQQGTTQACDDFRVRLLNFGYFDVSFDVADEGWVWLQRNDPSLPKFRDASGKVTRANVARNDTPANHDSHDFTADLLVDPGQEDVLTIVSGDNPDDPRSPDTLHLEWEIGTRPEEKSGDGDDPTFPKWAWPSAGDRLWANGHWILDCGHPTEIDGVMHSQAEFHPMRAIASMRNQARSLSGSGTTPVPVTATDLYIHGRGGYVVDQLNCGMDIMLADDPDSCATKTTPIAETFEFDICLPPRPSPTALIAWSQEDGPGNTLGAPLEIEPVAAIEGCSNTDESLDLETMLHVRVPLAGSGASPEDVYARRILAGWVFPPHPPLRRLSVRLDEMDLHDDHEFPGANGDMTFFWLNVGRAADEWFRLSDFDIPTPDDSSVLCGFDHVNTLDNYDGDTACGNGRLNFTGPEVDFYVRNDQRFDLRTVGYEQDCYEDSFGDHSFDIGVYVFCHGGNPLEVPDWGNNDGMAGVSEFFGPAEDPPTASGCRTSRRGESSSWSSPSGRSRSPTRILRISVSPRSAPTSVRSPWSASP